jgi:phage-related protein
MATGGLGSISGTIVIDYDDSGVAQATRDVNELGDAAQESGKKWDQAATVANGAAALIAGGFAVALTSALDAQDASSKLAAQLGLTAEESGRFGKIAGDLFANNYGASIAEVNDAIGAVVSSIEGMREASDTEINAMTADVLNLAAAFELDVARSAQIAGQIVKSGLVDNAKQGLDLLTVSLQKLPAAVREDLLDALDEYGPFLSQIGIKGEQAFSLLVASSEKGAFGLDKTGDALKEFTLLATDMSTNTKAAYDTLGISQEKATAALLKGGADGAKAFDQIVTGLLSIKDPVKQSQAALALFGTPLEDLNLGEIPQFLQSLKGVEGGLGDVEDATKRMGDTLNASASKRIETFKRQFMAAFIEQSAKAIPYIEKVLTFLERYKAVIGPLVATLGAFAIAIGAINLIMKIHAATVAAWTAITKAAAIATRAWTVIQAVFNAVFIASPIGLIVLAVVALAAVIYLVATRTKFFQTIWQYVWNFMKAVGAWFAGPFANFFVALWQRIVSIWNGIYAFFAGIIRNIVAQFMFWWNIVSAIIGFFAPLFRATFGLIASIVRLAWSIITAIIQVGVTIWSAIIGAVLDFIVDRWNATWNLVVGVINFVWGYLGPYIQANIAFIRSVIETFLGWITAAWNFVWGGLVNIVTAVWGFIGPYVIGTVKGIATAISATWNFIVNTSQTVWNGILSFLTFIWGSIVAVFTFARDKIVGIINGVRAVVDKIRGFFNDLRNAAAGGTDSLIAFVRGIPGKILNAIGNLGSSLYQKGRDLIQGLVNGISGMAGRIRSALIGLLPGPLKSMAGMLGLASPSKLFRKWGVWTVQGFINGIQAMYSNLQDTMASVANVATNPGSLDVTNTVRGSATLSGASTGAAAPVTVNTAQPQVIVVADLGNGVRQVVRHTIVDEPELVASANAQGTQSRGFIAPGRSS